MVARFVNGKSIRGMLHYNENKVEAGEARLILASGFASDVNQFSVTQKLQRFNHLAILNTRVKTNAIHISLNFDEKDEVSTARLQQIAMSYMEQIGFGEQPYLVYEHKDAAHTHVHIASINIKSDGSRIDTHGIGWKLSEPARVELEKEYGLIQAKGRRNSNALTIKVANLEKVIYGKIPTKRAITNIVNAVVNTYAFTSLAEFNAILRQFNVVADRGGENTLMREKGGLIYSIIDESGVKVGVPIKASSIYNKPILSNLTPFFNNGIEKRKKFREPLKNVIENTFGNYTTITKGTFTAELQKQNVQVLFRTNDKGFTYGITYIDNRNKAVFNGSDLGKAFSSKAIMDRMGVEDKPIYNQLSKGNTHVKDKPQEKTKVYLKVPLQTNYLSKALGIYQPDVAPAVSPKKRKKRNTSRSHDHGLNL